jgi:uncharacterized membrane protein
MSNLALALKLIHIVGAAVLFGTGLGIAYFMWMAHRTGEAALIAATARIVVIADALFTASAVIAQPVSGSLLAWSLGYRMSESWLLASLALYGMIGLCWLPVVGIQIVLRDLARAATAAGTPLPARYHRLFRIWFMLGWPAFLGVIAIFALMVWRPQLW